MLSLFFTVRTFYLKILLHIDIVFKGLIILYEFNVFLF